MKTLLVAAGLLVGSNGAWADEVSSYNFDDEKTPFVISDANRLSASYVLNEGSATDKYVKYSCGNMNAVAFAYYDFSTSVSDAATVTIDFDFYIATVAGHALVSIADANAHNTTSGGFTGKSNTGYGSNGAIFNLGCYRGGGNNKFAINSKQNDLAGLDAWCHVQVVVDNANKKVSYIITKEGEALISEEEVNFLNASANRCSQIDLYIGTNAGGNAIQIDNLVISKTVSDANHNYTINAMAGTTKLKELVSGMANENAGYSVSVPKVIVNDEKYYVLNDGQPGMTTCLAEFTMGTEDEIKEIQYTLDESVIFFKECEEIQQSYELATASGGYACGYYAKPVVVAIMESGMYQLETNITGRDGNSSLDVYTEEGTASVATFAKNCGTGIKTLDFFASGNMRIGGPYYNDKFNNSKSVDYILVRKINVPVTISAAGYATLYSDYALDFKAAGVKACIITGVDGSALQLEYVDDVPAKTPVILEGEAGNYSIPAIESSSTDVTANMLVGVSTDTPAIEGTYVLQTQEGVTGFYKVETEGITTVKAGKAYLNYTAPAAKAFYFDNATAIEAISALTSDAIEGIYTVGGAKVNSLQKGMNIVKMQNGETKKVLVK